MNSEGSLIIIIQLIEAHKSNDVIVGVRTVNEEVQALLEKYDATGRLTLVEIDVNSTESVKVLVFLTIHHTVHAFILSPNCYSASGGTGS